MSCSTTKVKALVQDLVQGLVLDHWLDPVLVLIAVFDSLSYQTLYITLSNILKVTNVLQVIAT